LPEERRRTAVTINLEKLKAVGEALEALLADDNAVAGDVLDANADLLHAAFPDHYRRIADAIGSFDFDTALAALRSATRTLA
jgi:two-component system sensor histidine kinase/response regulator